MQTVLIVFQLIISIALVITVLLQRSEGGALGMGGSGGGLGGFFSPRGAADTLTQATAILGILFFVTSLALTVLALHGRPEPTSILDSPAANGVHTIVPAKQAPAPANPKAPAIPQPH